MAGELLERSIAGQVEFWAQIGQALEPILNGDSVLALKRAGLARPLSELLTSVDTAEGRRRVMDYLEHRPFPHFEAHPDRPGAVIRIDADGTKVAGRFIGRRFQPLV